MYMQPALYNDADINENLERLYRDHQSFIFHMIRSIFPIEKVHRVKLSTFSTVVVNMPDYYIGRFS